nr:LPS-assembly protein LptD [Oryzicola mucosus]
MAGSSKTGRMARLLGASALACVFMYAVPGSAFAQQVPSLADRVPSDAQMLLEADTLVYDNDKQTVTAVGGVQIEYGGNRLVAQRVIYDRNTSRVVATGGVELLNSDGTKIYSDHIDITDDFADGFVNALRLETVDKTYFSAESGERRGGMLTTFNNGVYTACEPCEDKPDRAPIWQIKAKKIIWNGQTKTVRFEQSRFEFFGFPLAFLPAFEIADPTVKRKSGFLSPSIAHNSKLGYSVAVPYYLALAPTYDLTLTGRGYTKQGFLGEAEWRQRFNNGQYSLKMAGIHQLNPDEFKANRVNSGPAGDPNEFRGMIGTKGRFEINPRWAFGWDVMLQTDKNFSNTYGINGFTGTQTSQVYLTGLNDRNYFDLRMMKFQVQEDVFDSSPNARNPKQPWVLPSFDYAYIPDQPVAGGQLSIDMNARFLRRDNLDAFNYLGSTERRRGTPLIRGIEGTSQRVTAETEWKRNFITDGGLIITPLLAFQAEGGGADMSADSVAAINQMATDLGVSSDVRSSWFRYMATAGLELRWPVLFSATSSSHIIEPMVQVFARPNEQYVGGLGLPNEDAQSFVFDASTLFERDKFSGYDRMEGGSRANVGFRYSGTYDNGWSTNALFGQSYALGGQNSFASPDLVNVGAYSGLETDTSDFVALAGFASPIGLSGSLSGRFDEQTFEMRRTEVKLGYSDPSLSLTGKYAFIQAQPLYGFSEDRHEVTGTAALRLHENWRVFGSATYDIEHEIPVRSRLGFAYDDECFTYLMAVSRSEKQNNDVETKVSFNITFRTLGDFGSGTVNSLAP